MFITFKTKNGRMAIPIDRITMIYEQAPDLDNLPEEERNQIVEGAELQTYVSVVDIDGAYAVEGTLEENLAFLEGKE